jgi:hypothetical protein
VSFLAELRCRNVIPMAGLYLVGAWTELQKLLFAAKAPFRDYLYVIPQFEPLHKDPRCEALLKQIGLPLDSAHAAGKP